VISLRSDVLTAWKIKMFFLRWSVKLLPLFQKKLPHSDSFTITIEVAFSSE
jgi:hypothetical protein